MLRAHPAVLVGVIVALADVGEHRAADLSARIVLTGATAGELAARIRAEATQVNIAVVTDVSARDDESAATIAARHDAVGVLRIASSSAVALQLAGRKTAGGPLETFVAGPEDQRTFALRVVEEVRSRLVKLGVLPAPEPRVVGGGALRGDANRSGKTDGNADGKTDGKTDGSSSSAAADARVTADIGQVAEAHPSPATGPEWLAAAAGLAGVSAMGGMGPALGVALSLRVDLASGWGGAITGFWPLTTLEFSEAEGSAQARLHMATAEVDRLVMRRGWWSFALGAGMGVTTLGLTGTANAGYLATSDRLTAGIGFANGAMTIALGDTFAIRTTLTAGTTVPRPVVRFDGRETAALGRLFALATLALEVRPFASHSGDAGSAATVKP